MIRRFRAPTDIQLFKSLGTRSIGLVRLNLLLRSGSHEYVGSPRIAIYNDKAMLAFPIIDTPYYLLAETVSNTLNKVVPLWVQAYLLATTRRDIPGTQEKLRRANVQLGQALRLHFSPIPGANYQTVDDRAPHTFEHSFFLQ